MVNITHKQNSYRVAVAGASLTVSLPATIEAIENRRVPKGDVLECSRVAGLLAVKNTASVIPDCHPLPVEYCSIRHRIEGQTIFIEVEVHTIYKTGVEVEAMHGAAITALTLYDMLKPLDPDVRIGEIRLLQKRGGKSDRRYEAGVLRVALVVCSDSRSQQPSEDVSGQMATSRLAGWGLEVQYYKIIPDEEALIRQEAVQLKEQGFDMVIFCGGTGLGPRDHTPDVIGQLIDTPIPGIMEHARAYGHAYTPLSMLSRGVAGLWGNALFLTLPGSPRGVAETLDAIFPQVLHLFQVRNGGGHG